MPTLTQPLRDEHRDLMPDINALQTVGDTVGAAPLADLIPQIDKTIAFLAGHLLVHAQAEEAVLYPAVEQAFGSNAATLTMRRDHAAIRQMTNDLQAARTTLSGASLSNNAALTLRRLLYGLHAIVRLHLAKEEDVFLPALDAALTPAQAQALFAKMEATAHDLMAAAH